MPDILANGDFGRDDGIKCDECGGKTFLVDDQGGGLCSYECEDCESTFGVQFETDDEDVYEPEGWELAQFDSLGCDYSVTTQPRALELPGHIRQTWRRR